jgi:glutathione S-transferase
MAAPILWQFRFSHFNEKARWALDWKGIPHLRRSLVPGLHIPRVMWLTRQKAVPVLVLDGRVIADSTRIIEALERLQPEPALYPRNEDERRRALALEEHFDEELGPHIRRVLFHELLPFTDAAVGILTVGCGQATRMVYRALFPAVRAAMRMDMRIDEAGARRSREKVLAALDRLEVELGPAGYLIGDRFSVADLTAAALLAPLVMPPEFPYLPSGPLPDPVVRYRASLIDRPAARWAAEMYRRHRGRSAEIAA